MKREICIFLNFHMIFLILSSSLDFFYLATQISIEKEINNEIEGKKRKNKVANFINRFNGQLNSVHICRKKEQSLRQLSYKHQSGLVIAQSHLWKLDSLHLIVCSMFMHSNFVAQKILRSIHIPNSIDHFHRIQKFNCLEGNETRIYWFQYTNSNANYRFVLFRLHLIWLLMLLLLSNAFVRFHHYWMESKRNQWCKISYWFRRCCRCDSIPYEVGFVYYACFAQFSHLNWNKIGWTAIRNLDLNWCG